MPFSIYFLQSYIGILCPFQIFYRYGSLCKKIVRNSKNMSKIRFLHCHDEPAASMIVVMTCQKVIHTGKRTKIEKDVSQLDDGQVIIWMTPVVAPHLMMDGRHCHDARHELNAQIFCPRIKTGRGVFPPLSPLSPTRSKSSHYKFRHYKQDFLVLE